MRKAVKPFDGTKLDKQLRQRNLTRQEASKVLGFNRDYLTDCVRRGTISKDAIDKMEKVFFIKEEDIYFDKVEPQIEPMQTEMKMSAGITLEDITNAVSQGVQEALEAYFGKRAEPVAALEEKWKSALHSMEVRA